MTKARYPSWMPAILGTPALVAVAPPSLAQAFTPDAQAASSPAAANLTAVAALKAQLLAISPVEKLAISGDRLGADPLKSPAVSPNNDPTLIRYAAVENTSVCRGRVSVASAQCRGCSNAAGHMLYKRTNPSHASTERPVASLQSRHAGHLQTH